MKKIIASAASAALALSFSMAVPTTAASANEGAKEAVAWCKGIASATDYSVGECVSFTQQNGKVAFCRLLQEILPFDFPLGQCVSELAGNEE